MLNSTAPLWPQTAATTADAANDPWGLGTAMETQTRLWNQYLDANRNFWSFFAPWLSATPWAWNTALAPSAERDEAGVEPAQTVDGIPDALESQARSWNRFLDANRSFWTAVTWQVPGSPWLNAAGDEAGSEAEAEDVEEVRETPRPRSTARKTKGSRSRAG